MNKNEYTSKMTFILRDSFKFATLGPFVDFDNTTKLKLKFKSSYLSLKNTIFFDLKSATKFNPQVLKDPGYNMSLVKTHKKDEPLCSILSMTGSVQHQLV